MNTVWEGVGISSDGIGGLPVALSVLACGAKATGRVDQDDIRSIKQRCGHCGLVLPVVDWPSHSLVCSMLHAPVRTFIP